MNPTRISKIAQGVILASFLTNADAQWVGVSKGPVVPSKNLYYGWDIWTQACNNYIYGYGYLPGPTYDIRSGNSTVALTSKDIWRLPSEEEDREESSYVLIGIDNANSYNFVTHLSGPRWIPGGIWGFRVIYKDGSAVINKGIPITGSHDGSVEHFFKSVLPLDAITEKEVFYELLDQAGEIVGKFRVTMPDCESCQTATCDIKPDIGSVDYDIPIGLTSPRTGFEGRPCSLHFYQDQVPLIGKGSVSLVSPESGDPSIITTNGPDGFLDTVRIGDTFTRIEQLGGGATPISLRITVSSDWQNPTTTVFRTVTITNKNDGASVPYLEFDDSTNGTSTLTEYRESPTGDWILDTANGARRETRSITETPTERVVRTTVAERISTAPDTYSVVSDEATTFVPSPTGWQKSSTVTDPDGQALTTGTSFYQTGEDTSPDGSNSSAGVGRIKQILHPTGEIERHYYFDYAQGALFDTAHVVKRAFAGSQELKVTTTESATGLSSETGREVIVTRITERVGSVVISLVESSREDVIAAGFNGYVTEARSYSSPTEFTSTYTFESSGVDESTTVVNPDGTASISTKVINAATGYITATNVTGYVHDDPENGIPQVVMVTKNEVITDKYGEEIANSSYRYKDGDQVLISRKLATHFDAQHRTTRWEHFSEASTTPVFVTEREYACCGIARERDETGMDTYYAYDAQKRLVMTNRNGITTETVRQGLTTSTHRYAQSVTTGGYLAQLGLASPANEISRTVSDVNGDTVATWNRSAQDGSMVETTSTPFYNIGGGIGKRVVTHPPATADDGAAIPEQIVDYYLDGKPASTTGNLGPSRITRYAANATGVVTESAYLDGATEKETTFSQKDWAGRQVRMTYANDSDGMGGNDFSSSSYNSKGQLAMSIDPDGVTQLYGYNLRGEQTLTATDLNGNQTIDLSVDQVSSSETDLVTRRDGEWVMRTMQKAWLDPGSATGSAVAYSDVSLDGLRRWSIQNPTVQTHESTSVSILAAGGSRTETTTLPDGTSQTTTYVGGLVDTVTSRDSESTQLYQITTGYDSLNRPQTIADTRSGTSTQYYVNDATDVVNRAVDHLTRETLFTYDHRGRAKTTNLPDTLDESGATITNVSGAFYFPDGSVREQNGDGNYRMTQTYDYASRVETLTTYGTVTAVTRWVYDSNRGFLTGKRYNSPTPGSGTGPTYTYTAAGRSKTRTQARLVSGNPLITTYTYGTANGSSAASLDQVTHSDGTPAFSVTTRDRIGRPKVVVDDAAGTRSLNYTRHSTVEEETISGGILAGQKLEQDFDSLLRPRSHTASFGSQPLGETIYGYGFSGAVQSVSGNGGTARYFRHPQKRTMDTVTYTKSGETTPWLQSTRKHDPANRLTRITAHLVDAGVQKPVDHHAYAYDDLDRIQKHTDISGAFWKYGYNATGEVTGATKILPGGTTEVNGRAYRYHFDGIGNRTQVEQSRDSGQADRSFGYTPDALNQYAAMTHPDFVDVAGSAAPAATVTVNSQPVTRQGGHFRKELTEDNSSGPQWIDASVTDGTTITDGSLALPAASTTPTYDEDGNLTFDGLWNYTWDAENRLIRCERSAFLVSAGAPYLREEHDYDTIGRRIRTSIFTTSGGTTPASRTLFVFDGWKCVAELDTLSGNQAVRKYTWGLDLAGSIGDSSTGNVGALLWLVDTASNKTHVYHYEKNGNVSGLVDATTSKRSASYEYDAFGQLIACHGDYAKKNPFTFSTKYTDFTTGLCYYGYRWYSPSFGRWLSKDPIEENGGLNLYGFITNNPISYIDILGLEILTHATNASAGASIVTGGLDGPTTGNIWLSGPGSFSPTNEVSLHYDANISSAKDIPECVLKEGNLAGNRAAKGLGDPLRNPVFGGAKWAYINDWLQKQTHDVWRIKNEQGYHYAFRSRSAWQNAKPVLVRVGGPQKGIVLNALKNSYGEIRITSRAGTAIRIGGRVLFAAAAAVDAYDIYTAENRAKTTTVVAGGWIGANIGARGGAIAGAAIAGIGGQAGPQVLVPEEVVTMPVGAIIGGVVGGVGGYFVGREVTETVYEWTFERGF